MPSLSIHTHAFGTYQTGYEFIVNQSYIIRKCPIISSKIKNLPIGRELMQIEYTCVLIRNYYCEKNCYKIHASDFFETFQSLTGYSDRCDFTFKPDIVSEQISKYIFVNTRL